ncbi:ribonuclease Z [Peribacillus deserti]|uniref:Ribonuclease Z n=1 Tax=Peribacillus deserti TaxID=673318 RepID=A0A2N5M1H9_9BACI|nr:ribonuclease Z [Peribacillus deserti]PLT28244.1 ribonuclease Z [Peribacillus deserti]
MDFVFLGTGAGVPAKGRNVTSIALQLLEERGAVWLFDCGEATQHQILSTPVKPRKIEKIFITHLHGDHIFGLPGFLGSRSFQGGTTELIVYGPKGISEFIHTSLRMSETHLKYPLKVMEIEEGLIFEDHQFTVEAKLLEHALPTYGFRIIEKDRPGMLKAEKLKEMGISPGPVYRKLKQGETVQLEDGRILNGADYLDEPQKGRIITILGDTRYCENAAILAQDADYLIHEATFSADEEKMARDYWHSTTRQAALTAKKAGAANLILTHISSRYTGDAVKQLLIEAKEIFFNTIVAEDLMKVKIPLNGKGAEGIE